MPHLVRRTLLLCLAILAAVVAPAAAEVRSGTVTDPAGDAADARFDIRSVTARYDSTSGALTVAVTLGAAPSGQGSVYAIAGTPSAGACDAPTLALGASTDPARTTAVAVPGTDASGQRAATRTISGNTLTIATADATFAGGPYGCVTVQIDVDGATADALDTVVPLAVAATPVPLTRAQKLARALTACAARRGDARARCIAAARARYGPPVTRAQRLARATRACRARPAGPARDRCVATARRRFGAGGGTTAPRPGAPLAGRVYYFPGADPAFICGGVCWQGYAFIDDTWVSTELPDTGGLFPSCPAAGSRCKRYTFDPATRRGTVGGTPFTASAGLGTITPRGARNLFLGGVFRPGTRTALSLKGISVIGSPFLSQTVTTTWLEMAADGRFILSDLSLGSVGGPGAALEQHWSVAAPGSRGRYTFLAGGRLRLAFDDGRVLERTTFVLDADTGAAAREGIFFEGTLFTVEQ